MASAPFSAGSAETDAVLPGIMFGLAFVAIAVTVNRLLPSSQLRHAMLAILLSAAAAVYVGSSLAPQIGSAVIQTIAFVLFTAVALLGWSSAAVRAAGWLGHAVWDLLHLTDMVTAGTQEWYEIACLTADPLLAAYLLYALRRSNRVEPVAS